MTYPGSDDVDYTYDAVGNRETKNSTSYTYGDADQMTVAGGVSYTYDERGNQTERSSDDFAWDHENRLTQLTIGGATSSYTYNGDGVRMSRTTGGSTTNYVWDVAAGLPVILQDGTNTYVYGLGLISTYDGSAMTYRLTDGLGSTANLCDASGNVTVSYTYDAFGAHPTPGGRSSNLHLAERACAKRGGVVPRFACATLTVGQGTQAAASGQFRPAGGTHEHGSDTR